MSELEKTAPNEIYLIVGDTDKDCNFNELAEVTWADEPIYEETAIKYVKSPQFTISKSIADEIEEKALDDYGVFQTLAQKKHIISDPEPFCDLSDEFISWCENNEKWWAIMNAYLAGKALGVDLVKVGEG
ncbi:hypothetical protein [Lactococcus lactis]|uniref:hypothetical protein n=1 Tax=Lactococcus lactis TaxID=1358 RepID=UPI00034B363E|nr:hypothetical protein [Lactococcus lactis]